MNVVYRRPVFLTSAVSSVSRFVLYSASFGGRSRDVSWLVSKFLNVACALVFVVLVCRLCELSVTIKDKSLRRIEVYAANDTARRAGWFCRINPYFELIAYDNFSERLECHL